MKNDKPHAGETRWEIELNIECPQCSELFDANRQPDFHEQIRGVQVCEPKKNVEVACPECDCEFIFDIAGGT